MGRFHLPLLYMLVLGTIYLAVRYIFAYYESQPSSESDRVDVILLAYARGGSTYVGHILGNNDDTFYFYEPLTFPGHKHDYFTKDSICKFNTPYCRNIDSSIKLQIQTTLNAIFNCDDKIFRRSVWQPYQRELGGTRWDIHSKSDHDWLNLQKICRSSRYRVAKITRMSAEYLKELLVLNSKLKIVYLFRDPRGTINSRINSTSRESWKNEFENTEEVAQALCRKMEIDAKEITRLQKIFPSRVISTLYENIAQYPEENIRKIFNFLKIGIKESYIDSVKNLGNQKKDVDMVWNSPLRSNGSASSVQWKKELSSTDIQIIDSNCRTVYKMLGFKVLN